MSDYVDGALELGEQLQTERHLADCEPCRTVRDDLLQIVHFSRQLPLHTPSGTIWTRIQSEVTAQQKAGFSARASRWWASLRGLRLNLTVPQMAVSAAAMALILAVSVIALRRDAGAPAPMGAGDQAKDAKIGVNLLSNPENNSDIKQYEQRIDHLKQSIEQRMVAWNPELRMTYERNMLYVDQSLAECRHELNNNPGDQDSEALMLNAYREKVRLLEGFSKF